MWRQKHIRKRSLFASTSNSYLHKMNAWHLIKYHHQCYLTVQSHIEIRPIYIFKEDLERILRKLKSV